MFFRLRGCEGRVGVEVGLGGGGGASWVEVKMDGVRV